MKISEKNGIVKWEDDIPPTHEWMLKAKKELSKRLPDVPVAWLPSPEEFEDTLFREMKKDETLTEKWETENRHEDWHDIMGDWVHIIRFEDCIYVNGAKINLLPKESTMRTRYAVVNLREKVEFEKKWEMSYGYNNCPHIGFTQKDAMEWVKRNLGPTEKKDYIVERHNAGKVDIVWKIDSLIGIQEEDEHDEEF